MKNFIEELDKQGIKISLKGEGLSLCYDKDVEIKEETIQSIKENKKEILKYLSAGTASLIPVSEILPEGYPVTPSQYRMWLLSQLSEVSSGYNISFTAKITGTLDIEVLQDSFRVLMDRYDILRTCFKYDEVNDTLKQFVVTSNECDLDFSFNDYSEVKDDKQKIESYIQNQQKHSFDLHKPSQFRISIFKVEEDVYSLFMSMHHIISDGWSMNIMISEIFKIYFNKINNNPFSLAPLSIQYKDYTIWQKGEKEGLKYQKAEEFWKEQFSEHPPLLELPSPKKRPEMKTFNGRELQHSYSSEFSQKLKDFSRLHQTSLFTILESGIKILLYRYSGQRDMVIGTPVAGREHPDLENQIGLFINILPLRTIFEEKNTFSEIVQKENYTFFSAYQHQIYPFDELIHHLNLSYDASRSLLFDILIVFQNQNQINNEAQEIEGLRIEFDNVEKQISRFDMTFTFREAAEELSLAIEYNTDIYEAAQIEKIFLHFENLITQAIERETQDNNKLSLFIEDIDFLTESERNLLLYKFNDTKTHYPENKTVVELFEEQAENAPDSTAVYDNKISLNYRELKEKSDRVAEYLISNFGENNEPVSLLIDRSAELIIILLGILKSGKCYIPIDPTFPKERIEYIINHSQTSLVITEKEFLQEFNSKVSFITKGELLHFESAQSISLNSKPDPKDTAYIIYTSGSTGSPKGVEIRHQALTNFLTSIQNEPGIQNKDILYSVTTYSFDISILEIFAPLITGAGVFIAHKETLNDVKLLKAELESINPTIIQATPSFYQMLFNTGWKGNNNLKIFCGGDSLNESLMEKLLANTKEVWNMYGPTETTIWSSTKKIEKSSDTSIIGKPINNTQIYIIDENLNPLPLHAVGRIFIAGDGLAKGYYKNEPLTQEKFVDNPFEKGTKMYDTGDLGKWNEKGEIEFLGRKDFQVKIRGFRIELGEIETNISHFSSGIDEVIADAREVNGEKVLVAYYTANKETEINKIELREYLQNKLPEYMVPGFFVELENIPLTPNGKIDRKALPGVTGEDIIRREYLAPRNETEYKLAEIWQEVLGVDKVGITDNFFELGGHSLMVAQVLNRIHQNLAQQVSFKNFFDYPTIEGIIKNLTRKEYTSIPTTTEQNSYPLTPSQQRLWVLSQLEGGSQAYNMPAIVTLKGELNNEYFEQAFSIFIDRHEITRTSFRTDEASGELRQYITPKEDIKFKITLADFTKKKESEIEKYLQYTYNEAFNLEQSPLLKASLLKRADDEYLLLLSMHHIIGDGWSTEILISEVIQNYNRLIQGESIQDIEENTQALSIQYKDYAVWLQGEIKSEKYQKSEKYWLEQFKGELPIVELPSYNARPLIQTYNGNHLKHWFSKEFTGKLKKYSEKQGATLFMTLMAGVNALLYRYTGQQDIIIGMPIAGREHPDLENQIGLYLNTLAIRTKLEENITFRALVQKEKDLLLSAYEHQIYPFDELVGKLNLKRNTSRSALFDVLVVFQNQNQLKLGNTDQYIKGLQAESYDYHKKTSQFDVSYTFTEEEEQLGLMIEYNTDIYDDSLIHRMFIHFENLLTSAMDNEAQNLNNDHTISNLGEIDFLTREEKKQLVYESNDTETDYPSDKTIVELFEEQVRNTPENIALVFENIELTYRELNEEANQLGAYLRETYTIQPDNLIAIELEKSEKMIVAIIGVLKSGAGYVPIDLEYPEERIDYIKEDTRIKVTINELFFKNFKEDNTKRILPKNNLPIISRPDNLAYIIYTSGTTGQPKGVMIENRSVVSLVKPGSYFTLNDKNVLLSTGSINFDATILEYFGTLLNGAKLILVNTHDLLDPEILSEKIEMNLVDSMWMTASWFNQVSEQKIELFKNIKQLIIGGDTLSPQPIIQLQNTYPDIKIVNGYGPTENTTFSSTYPIKEIKSGSIPIGKPLENSSIYILDDNHKVVPLGVSGKLYVSGAGLSRGYLNKPDLTKEKFVDNPFKKGTKMYDTGDLGRWLPDGNIEFLGRKDFQVKIRGYRIELGEIETNILQFNTNIKQVVADAKELNGEKVLVAYYTTDNQSKIDKSELKDYLQHKLPEYSLPNFFVELEHIPLTSNGKTDRRALPEIQNTDLIKHEFVAPKNENEQLLVEIWQEILGIERIGVTDNFYNLGGDSIKSIQVSSKLRKKGKILNIVNILKNPTIISLAEFIENVDNEEDQGIVLGNVPLAPIQHYFFGNEYIKNKNYYNQSVVLTSKEGVDPLVLDKTIEKLVFYHDILRARYLHENGVWKQSIENMNQSHYSIHSYDLSNISDPHDEIIEISKFLQSSLDISSGVLFKIGHIKLENEDLLIFIIHHLIIDGVSWRILLKDFNEIYESIVKDKEVKLIKSTSYKKWTETLLKYSEKETFLQESAYWNKMLSCEIPVIPVDYPCNNPISDGYANFSLSEKHTQALKTTVHRAYNTDNTEILLIALGLAVKDVFDIEKVLVKMERHGREDIGENLDLSNTLGWFTTIYPFLLDVGKNQKYSEIIQVKEDVRKVPNKGIGYNIFKYIKKELNHNHLYSIQFNFLGDFDNTFESKDNSQFNFADYSIASSVLEENAGIDYLFSISGMIVNGVLSLSIIYSLQQFSEKTVQNFKERFKTRLESIIEECDGIENNIKTPSDLTHHEISIEELSKINKENDVEDILPLSPMQEGFYYQWLLNKDTYSYGLCKYYKIESSVITLKHIEKAYAILINKIDVLRTGFYEFSSGIVQVVYNGSDYNFKIFDKEYVIPTEITYDLSSKSQSALFVRKSNENTIDLYWHCHHIIIDGWSAEVLMGHFMMILKNVVKNDTDTITSLGYSKFIEWITKNVDHDQTLEYWKNILKDSKKSHLPFKKNHGITTSHLIREYDFVISGELYERLVEISIEHSVTMNTLMQTTWGILLANYNSSSEATFGVVVSCRQAPIERIEETIGLFSNTIPFRITFKEDEDFPDLFKRVQAHNMESLPHQYLSLGEIFTHSGTSIENIDSIVIFENFPRNTEELEEGEEALFEISGHEEYIKTNSNFNVLINQNDEKVKIKFKYNDHLYTESGIQSIHNNLIKILSFITK